MTLKPINQTNLYGLDNIFNELNNLFSDNKLPNKILFSGKKGIGKSTLSYHLINCILSKDEEFSYDTTNHTINRENKSFKLIQNGSNPNFNLIDVSSDKKMIEINQIRNLINKINKSSFNDKPRFILIDNIEYLNINSANALLKSLEEPNQNIFFILINNQKKILPTIKSRCLNFNISLTYNDTISIIDNILGENVLDIVNNELLSYYFSPGNIYNLIQFSKIENIDLKNVNTIIHLASIANDPMADLDKNLSWETSALGTLKLINSALKYKVKKIIYASSGSVYGIKKEKKVHEDLKLKPLSLYNKVKMVTERVLLSYNDKIDINIVRPGTVCGYSPRMRYDLVVNTLLIRALRDKQFSVFGGDQWRPFVHCYDVARAFKLALEADKVVTHNQIFNVGSDDMNYTIDNIGEKVADKLPKSKMNTVQEDVDKRNYKVSFSKISKLLKFEKKYTIEMGLDEMISEAKKNNQLLKYEDKIYSNFNHLKNSYEQ